MVMFGILFCFLLCRLLFMVLNIFCTFFKPSILKFQLLISHSATRFSIYFILFISTHSIAATNGLLHHFYAIFHCFFMIFCFFLFADFERESMMSLSLIWFDHLTLVLSLFDWIKRFLVRIFEPTKTRWWCINTDILCHSRFSTLETY